MSRCLIALGSNLGDCERQLQSAIEHIRAAEDVRLVAQSSFHRTSPAGGPRQQQDYLNAAVTVDTNLSPQRLLAELQRIENNIGRTRDVRWGPRVIDLDLLLYEDAVCQEAELELPHPRMAFRRFVLEPAAEIAPGMVHPIIGWSVARLLQHLNETLPYAAITGWFDRRELAIQVAKRTDSRLIATDPLLSTAGLQERLEQLSDIAQTLSADRLRCDETIVSDFWFSELLIGASELLHLPDFERFEKRFEDVEGGVAGARLVVLVESNAEPPSADAESCYTTIRDAVGRWQGPVLEVSRYQESLALDEITAAIQAMR